MNDPDFETELFALYGEPSEAVSDDGVTRKILNRIAREDRLRGWALTSAVAASAAGTLAAVMAFGEPLMRQLSSAVGAPIGILWALPPAASILIGWATIRIVTNE